MTAERALLLILAAIAIAQGLTLSRVRRPDWWRRMDLHSVERLMLERFDTLGNQLTKVVAGLHEDIDGLRQELRAMASLPPETQIPRIVHDLRWLRVAVVSLLVAVVVLAALLARHATAAPFEMAL